MSLPTVSFHGRRRANRLANLPRREFGYHSSARRWLRNTAPIF
jgi:hypothetical protein